MDAMPYEDMVEIVARQIAGAMHGEDGKNNWPRFYSSTPFDTNDVRDMARAAILGVHIAFSRRPIEAWATMIDGVLAGDC